MNQSQKEKAWSRIVSCVPQPFLNYIMARSFQRIHDTIRTPLLYLYHHINIMGGIDVTAVPESMVLLVQERP
jgi:hypothetical protein